MDRRVGLGNVYSYNRVESSPDSVSSYLPDWVVEVLDNELRLKGLTVGDSSNWDMLRKAYSAVANKCFFVTESGYFGLTRHAVAEGDEIAVLAGSDYPFILRPVTQQDGHECYRIIAPCYCEDLMYGEAVTARADTSEDVNAIEAGFKEIALV